MHADVGDLLGHWAVIKAGTHTASDQAAQAYEKLLDTACATAAAVLHLHSLLAASNSSSNAVALEASIDAHLLKAVYELADAVHVSEASSQPDQLCASLSATAAAPTTQLSHRLAKLQPVLTSVLGVCQALANVAVPDRAMQQALQRLLQQCREMLRGAHQLREQMALVGQQEALLQAVGHGSQGGLAFAWVESPLVQAARRGDWVSACRPEPLAMFEDVFMCSDMHEYRKY